MEDIEELKDCFKSLKSEYHVVSDECKALREQLEEKESQATTLLEVMMDVRLQIMKSESEVH